MTKEKSKNLIKKVRKEIKPVQKEDIIKHSFETGKTIGYEIGLYDGKQIGRTGKNSNHAITLIIVWLAVLTVLAIYVSIK